MSDQLDLLKIKIDAARSELSENTKTAIDRVDWKGIITKMRETRGFSFEQLGNLETETELLLCGLLSSEDYPQRLEKEMGMTKAQVEELLQELNKSIFQKIREEFIKISEGGNKNTINNQTSKSPVINTAPSGIKITTILDQKLGGVTKTSTTTTDHSIQNVQPSSTPKVDPYRELPE